MIDWSKLRTAEQIEAERLESLAKSVRIERDKKMADVVNWYQRYDRETRLKLPHVLSLKALDTYATALADLPQQNGFPENIIWPTL